MMIRNAALVGALVTAIAASSSAFAQDRPGPGVSPDASRQWRPSTDDINAFVDARVAALKAGLRLTPAQEKNWPAFEQAYRDFAKVRADQIRAFRDHRQNGQAADNRSGQTIDPVARVERRADTMLARGNALKALGTAAAPLYQSLDDGQKHRFVVLSRLMRHPHHLRFAARERQQAPDLR